MNRHIMAIFALLALLLCACAARQPQRVLPLPDPDAAVPERVQLSAEAADEPTRGMPAAETEPLAPEPSPEPTAEPELLPLHGAEAESDTFPFVGSRNSSVYHHSDCAQAERIKAENRVGWESETEALAEGRKPCSLCCREETALETRAVPTAEPSAYLLVGSRLSDKYHDPDCRYAKKIEPENLLGWDSTEAAQADGYAPCGVCKPG